MFRICRHNFIGRCFASWFFFVGYFCFVFVAINQGAPFQLVLFYKFVIVCTISWVCSFDFNKNANKIKSNIRMNGIIHEYSCLSNKHHFVAVAKRKIIELKCKMLYFVPYKHNYALSHWVSLIFIDYMERVLIFLSLSLILDAL